MDLHNRLKELNNLPEDHVLKARIYESINKNKKSNLFKWKELFLIIAISAIALFLVFVPENESKTQTSDSSIQAIYMSSFGKQGKFSARSSNLYTFVDKVEDPATIGFFEYFSTYVKEADGTLGKNIIDVLVIRNGQEERYQLSDTGMLRVDTGQFYVGNSDMYRYELALFFLHSERPYKWIALFPLIISIMNLISSAYYKHHQIKEVNLFKTNPWLFVFITLIFSTVLAWAVWIGPLYKPLLIVLILLYGIVTRNTIKQKLPSYSVYKFETLKMIITTAALVISIILL